MEDWKQSYTTAYAMELKHALDQGWRPRDLDFHLDHILQKPESSTGESEKSVDSLEMGQLDIKDE